MVSAEAPILMLDQDQISRLENVLQTEAAKDMLGVVLQPGEETGEAIYLDQGQLVSIANPVDNIEAEIQQSISDPDANDLNYESDKKVLF